jgi:hypothetical protein
MPLILRAHLLLVVVVLLLLLVVVAVVPATGLLVGQILAGMPGGRQVAMGVPRLRLERGMVRLLVLAFPTYQRTFPSHHHQTQHQENCCLATSSDEALG